MNESNSHTVNSVPLPRKLQIEPVGRCNLRCPMCAAPYRPVEDGPALIELDLVRALLADVPAIDEVHLQGIGEPLLHPAFFDLVALATRRGARVTTNSNLTVLTDRMAYRCVESGLDTLHVSIDAADARLYGAVRVGARLERVLENVDKINEAKNSLGRATPRLALVMVLMRQTEGELPGVLRLAAEKGFESVFVQCLSHRFLEPDLPERYQPLREFAASEGLDDRDPAVLSALLTEAREQANTLGLAVRLPRPDRPTSTSPGHCDWPWTQAYVCYDGSVLPCCMASTPDRVCLGSVVERPLSEVWRGPAFTEFRRALSSPKPPSICRSCSLYWGVF